MRGRVTVALLLTIGFYGLALGIAGGLLSIAWLFWVNGHHVNRVTAFCVIGAGVILWSIVPRPERFQPPGPALEAASNPRLFKELNDVASRVGEPMPHEVYLVPDVNAGVRQRGGFMGARRPARHVARPAAPPGPDHFRNARRDRARVRSLSRRRHPAGPMDLQDARGNHPDRPTTVGQ